MTTQTRSTLDEAFVRELARAGVCAPLFAWWGEHARALPWRTGQTTPWGGLGCEVRSQQTQRSRVVLGEESLGGSASPFERALAE